MTTPVLVTRPAPSVTLLTINRPEARNSLNVEVVDALAHHLDRIASEGSTRAVVLTGAGSAFCAGADLATLEALQGATTLENEEDCARLLGLYRRLATLPLPVLCAANGPALAGGCGLASLCDMVIAAEGATFGYPEVRIGFVAAMVLVILARQVGERFAREVLLTGRTLTAEEALAMGLVNRVVPSDSLLEEALAEAERLGANAPAAMAMTKELLWHTSGLPLERAMPLAAKLNVFARLNPEMREGLSAFFQKRRPRW